MPTGRHHPRLSPFSFPHDFKTSPRFRSERNHSTFKIHPRLPPFSLCTILKSPPVPTLKIHPRLSPSRKWFFFSIYALMEKYRKWLFFSIYALMEQYCFRRFSHTNTRRQTSPPATATVSVDSQREAEIYRNTTTLQDAPGRFLCAMCAKLGEILKSCTS